MKRPPLTWPKTTAGAPRSTGFRWPIPRRQPTPFPAGLWTERSTNGDSCALFNNVLLWEIRMNILGVQKLGGKACLSPPWIMLILCCRVSWKCFDLVILHWVQIPSFFFLLFFIHAFFYDFILCSCYIHAIYTSILIFFFTKRGKMIRRRFNFREIEKQIEIFF